MKRYHALLDVVTNAHDRGWTRERITNSLEMLGALDREARDVIERVYG